MTLPEERTRAVLQSRFFLQQLCDSERTPGVPDAVRREARKLLRHFPDAGHIHSAAIAWPSHWSQTCPEPGATPPSYIELLAQVRDACKTD